jgi:hypothetical protein
MVANYKEEDCYTVAEVAKILNLSKQAVNSRCKSGYYEGAIPPKPNQVAGDPHGKWLIPKHLIDTPHIVQDVATLTRQISPTELERCVKSAITETMNAALDPFVQSFETQRKTIYEQTEKIRNLEGNIESLTTKMDVVYKNIDTVLIEARADRKKIKEEGNSAWLTFALVIAICAVVGLLYKFVF